MNGDETFAAVARVLRELRAEFKAAIALCGDTTHAEFAAAIAQVEQAIADVTGAHVATVRDEVGTAVERTLATMHASADYAARLDDAIARAPVVVGATEQLGTVAQLASALAVQVQGAADELLRVRAELVELHDVRRGLADAVAALSTPTPWAQGGVGYREHALVVHRGGLWCACADTHDEPGTGGAWALIADGLAALEATTTIDGELQLACTFASGRVAQVAAPLPRWTARGLWSAEAVYAVDDVVVFDGCTWLALGDVPEGPPPGDGWQVVAMRGARGRRGEPGERGEPGASGPRGAQGARGVSVPVIDTGIALRAWRGPYTHGETYLPGDIVARHGGVFLCVDHPFHEAPGRGATAWVTLSGGAA